MNQDKLAQRLVGLIVSDPLSPQNQSAQAAGARLKVCLQMADEGLLMKSASLRRKHPHESDEKLHDRLVEWLHFQPEPSPGQDLKVSYCWPRNL